MKTLSPSPKRSRAAYVLLMVLLISLGSVMILSGTLSRTYNVVKLNDRNQQFVLCQNAAEAAVEKAYARIAYDFSTPGLGLGSVSNNITALLYQNNIPNEVPFFTNFIFSDGAGHDNRISVFPIG